MSDLFDAARRAISIEELAGKYVKLVGGRNERRGPCPICKAGEKSASPPFAVKPLKGTFNCYVCEAFGDVSDLYAAVENVSTVEAAKALSGGHYEPSANARATAKPQQPQGPTGGERVAGELLSAARPFEGSLAEKYLLARGAAPEVVAEAAPNLRFHPNAKHHWDEAAGRWVRGPAMLAPVVTPYGPTGGVHATYLARDGKGKSAELSPAKRMWGPQIGREGLPGGAWLIGPDAPAGTPLVVAEGIETALSYATLARFRGLRMRVAAALSLGRLQGRLLRDEEGCIDIYEPQPDPAGPAFTWPSPEGARWTEIVIAVDRDMSPVKARGRTGRGKPCDFEIDGEARAAICARLACAWWALEVGPRRVRAVRPSPGCDFNDELRRVLARGAGA